MDGLPSPDRAQPIPDAQSRSHAFGTVSDHTEDTGNFLHYVVVDYCLCGWVFNLFYRSKWRARTRPEVKERHDGPNDNSTPPDLPAVLSTGAVTDRRSSLWKA